MIEREPKRPRLDEGAQAAGVLSPAKSPSKVPVFCICKQPLGDRRDGNGMIQCVRCKDWFHLSCIGFLTSRRGAGGGYTCDQCKQQQPAPPPPPPLPEPEPPKEKRPAIKIECRQCLKEWEIGHCGISKKQHRHYTSFLCTHCNPEHNKLYCLCRKPWEEGARMLQCFECCDWFHPACVETTCTEAAQQQGFYCPICTDCANDGAAPRFCVCRTRNDRKKMMLECTKCHEWYHPECIGVSNKVSPVGFLCTICTAGQKLFCICRQPNTVNQRPMIECAGCKSWFHMDCCNVSKSDANSFELDWQCPSCRRGLARSNKTATANSRRFKKEKASQTQLVQELVDRTEVVEILYPWNLDIQPFVISLKAGQEDEYTTADELVETMLCMAEQFSSLQVPAEAAAQARQELDFKGLRDAAKHFNAAGLRLGLFDKAGSEDQGKLRPRPSSRMVAHIMAQVYHAAVTDPKALNHYSSFSAEVYGEANPILISELIRTVPIKPGDIFLDMGSGVGQVALQVAAEVGVEHSYGIELRDIPAQYAVAMDVQFRKRMKMYGQQHSAVSLLHGNFLDPESLPNELLQKVDVIFCNNVAFEASLNAQLADRFMDLKENAKIVSLVSFGKRKTKTDFRAPVEDHRIKVPVQKDWMFNCEGCGMRGQNLDDGEAMVQCASCEVWMHMSCVGIGERARVPKQWVCRGCSWEEQKQSRTAEQEILKVEGPYVCDIAGAVSWTSNEISYYIHTVEHSEVLLEGCEKLYDSAHARKARAAQKQRAQSHRASQLLSMRDFVPMAQSDSAQMAEIKTEPVQAPGGTSGSQAAASGVQADMPTIAPTVDSQGRGGQKPATVEQAEGELEAPKLGEQQAALERLQHGDQVAASSVEASAASQRENRPSDLGGNTSAAPAGEAVPGSKEPNAPAEEADEPTAARTPSFKTTLAIAEGNRFCRPRPPPSLDDPKCPIMHQAMMQWTFREVEIIDEDNDQQSSNDPMSLS